jgi:magnesium chelatase family protein
MIAKTYAAALYGINAITVTIEVNISQGINFFIVGLPDSAVKESQQRIDSALKTSGFRVPKKRMVINMAPADMRKEGSAYDLPLAIGILAASEIIPPGMLDKYIIMGELSLDGQIRSIRGVLPMAVNARDSGFRGIILPYSNAREAGVIKGLDIYGMDHILEVVSFFEGELVAEPVRVDLQSEFYKSIDNYGMDFSDVKGQTKVKRALEIAAAGGHNLLMTGSPGAGKSMLAKRLPSILPPLTLDEAIETTKVHSVAGKLGREASLVTRRPFRDPHHTISDTAMVGGGSYPQPGEISLAHNGVLFLDELPEFRRNVLEVLRQPMEGRLMTISRARYTIDYPASFMLVASMNPCPCGYYNHPEKECVCMPGQVQQYLNRVSGPLLDRIDIHIEVVPVSFSEISKLGEAEKSSAIRIRVSTARQMQQERLKDIPGVHNNAQMTSSTLRRFCQPDDMGLAVLKNAMEKLHFSARAYIHILKVSRTIADLDCSEGIKPYHLAEAINYRNLDREGWGG